MSEEEKVKEEENIEETVAEEQPVEANEADEWHTRYMRLAAEFDNFKRRTNKEKEELLKFGNSHLLKALLPLLDNLDRTLAVAETSEPEALIKSLKLVQKNLTTQLEKQSVKAFDSLGEEFDSELHEAIASMPVDDESKKGKIIEEIEKGYMYQDRVIRYAKVITGE